MTESDSMSKLPSRRTRFAGLRMVEDYDGTLVIRQDARAMLEPDPVRATPPEIGELVPGKGIYVGQYQGSKTFNLYAAPEDLKDPKGKRLRGKFAEIVDHVAALRGWHGHDGTNLNPTYALHQGALHSRHHGGWFIPSEEMIVKNLVPNISKGALKDTFFTKGSHMGFLPTDAYCYRTGEYCDVFPEGAFCYVVDIRNGNAWRWKNFKTLSVRLVRAEPVP